MSKNIFLLIIFFILILIFSCKTTDNNGSNIIKDPTTQKIDKNTSKDKLKEHMKALFELIEEKIAKGDFEGWYNSISLSYKEFLKDSRNLRALSESSDYLYNRKILLKSAKDYFFYVVMQSREGKILEFLDCEFINDKHVKVLCLFDKKDKLVYDFIYEDGSWKVGY